MGANVRNAEAYAAWLSAQVRQRSAAQVQLYQRVVAVEVFQRIIERTPVDYGFARGNWQVAIGAPILSTIDRTDPSGAATKAAGNAVIASVVPYCALYISNSAPYITVLEDGGFVPTDPGPTKDKRRWPGATRVALTSRHAGGFREGGSQDIEERTYYRWRGGTPVTLVRGGFSVQAPHGMVAVSLAEVISGDVA